MSKIKPGVVVVVILMDPWMNADGRDSTEMFERDVEHIVNCLEGMSPVASGDGRITLTVPAYSRANALAQALPLVQAAVATVPRGTYDVRSVEAMTPEEFDAAVEASLL